MSGRSGEPAGPPNDLAGETSPYLLQHARNPVRWMPWGEAAFAEARRRQVPIFLSIGYSTCYWCHVMERESFEDAAIGAALSGAFVCIKVDREERPDVDDIYMTAVQLTSGRGGWPMSVWLTPPGARGPEDRGLEPFYAGTYFPAEPRHGMPSLPQLVEGISAAWRDSRDQVLEQAGRIAAGVRESFAAQADPVAVGERQIGLAVAGLLRIHDEREGGFGRAPKFPQPVFVQFLLEARGAIEDPAVASTVDRAVRLTLDRMALGGMYDQVGGGFHRYSTDEKWLVPHFEKMLYDNAQLASLYAASHRATGDRFDARVCREALDYVLREMTDPGTGAFFSAQDAEVNHREGQNYLWTRAQLEETLGANDGVFAAELYGVTAGTNFRDPHHPGDAPSNVLFLAQRPESYARARGLDAAELQARIDSMDARLLAARARRDQPHLDDKVITSWNGLMIAAFADGAAALGDPKYLRAAEKAADWLWRTMLVESRAAAPDDPAGRVLLRTSRVGVAKTPGFLEDYAMLAHGMIRLHRAVEKLGAADPRWLERAKELMTLAELRFGDPARSGLYFDTAHGQSDLLVRTRTTHDGAIPSAAGFMLHNWIDLHELTGDVAAREKALASVSAVSSAIDESPVGAINATRGLLRLLRADPSLAARLGEDTPDGPEVVHLDEPPVEIFAPGERLSVTRAAPATLPVEIRIKPGFHITAREPGIEGLAPLDIRLSGGTGLALSVCYPPGTPYRGAALPEEEQGRMLVHSGTLRLDLTLTRTDEPRAGRPMILITYQACDESACYQPMTVELDVALDPGE